MSTISSCVWTVSAWSSGGLCELTDFSIRNIRKMCKNNCVGQLACWCWVSSAFLRKLEDRLTLLRSSTLISSGVLSAGSTTGCVAGSSVGLRNLSRPVSGCSDTWDLQCVARRPRGEVRYTRFLRNYQQWQVFLRLAPHYFHIFQRWTLSLFPFFGVAHFYK